MSVFYVVVTRADAHEPALFLRLPPVGGEWVLLVTLKVAVNSLLHSCPHSWPA